MKNSKFSIQIALDGVYLKVFDTDTANIYFCDLTGDGLQADISE